MPHLSIIIPTLNEGTQINDCLSTLVQYDSNDVEIIVVDGGSTDNTLAIASVFANKGLNTPKVLVQQTEKGRANQMNMGASVAGGNYLLFLHADTILPNNFIELLKSWQQTDLKWGFFPVKLSGNHWLLRWVERSMNIRSSLTGIGTGDQCLFMRQDLFQAIGGFPAQPLMEDVELCTRLKKLSLPSVQPAVVITSSRRWEQNGIVKTILLMWRFRLAYFFGASPHKLVQSYYKENSK